MAERQGGRFNPGERVSPATEIKPGERRSPETEIQSGQRLSPATEFKKGQAAHNRVPVGTERVRTFRGVQRAWVKVAEPNVWRERAKLVWEEHNGPIPRGRTIHHRDRDTLNDAPDNLQALTRREHALEHLDEVRAGGFGSDEAIRKANAARRRAAQ